MFRKDRMKKSLYKSKTDSSQASRPPINWELHMQMLSSIGSSAAITVGYRLHCAAAMGSTDSGVLALKVSRLFHFPLLCTLTTSYFHLCCKIISRVPFAVNSFSWFMFSDNTVHPSCFPCLHARWSEQLNHNSAFCLRKSMNARWIIGRLSFLVGWWGIQLLIHRKFPANGGHPRP